MYQVCVRRHFDAAHALRGYQGRCENLHGHRYEVVACVKSGVLNEIGLAFDFTEFKRELDAILDGLDHRNLNETYPFDECNPSAENIAKFIYDTLQAAIPDLSLEHVQVYESPNAWATFSPD
ncbi:MAG: 6-carboxytetrahydropterin synthase QueD [Anaerolineae bacterium]|nr:6-carboxytetrahydropterin synthase QueD [Anaerolineae bacterium]